MFPRVFKSAVIVSVVAFLATANGVPTATSNNQCDTGNESCCQHLVNSTSPEYGLLGGLLGLGTGDILGDIGLDCLPINVLGIGNAADCQGQAVCCTQVSQIGLINLGCSPLNVNL